MSMCEHIKQKLHSIHIGLSNFSLCPLASFTRNSVSHSQRLFRPGSQPRTKRLHTYSHYLTRKRKTTQSMAHISKKMCPLRQRIVPKKPSGNFKPAKSQWAACSPNPRPSPSPTHNLPPFPASTNLNPTPPALASSRATTPHPILYTT